ncbi:MaoC family dehydratase [Vibrio alfacsensis]|uniref:MaoC family dehydratase n=1 Tax=Vibrio alfacsensis TaxID=1074311 RepID=UPI001BF10F84|nr:MaoC family dehydratase [Vibrio alfacsensis]WQE79140.1 MaoC family dehydratase [Vibrio alfacsensis]BCN27274.1 MaoC family dehydratase [Vibrio alfacsensis]
MANVIITNPEQLLDLEGKTLGTTAWLTVSQQRINLFAEATNDHQWIHVDEEKAAQGPFGACIAHGYLTLSLASDFLFQLIDIQNLAMGVNYGCNKIRFPAPVPVGSEIRGRGDVISVEQIGEAYQAIIRITIEIEGSERPGCVVDTISRYSFK